MLTEKDLIQKVKSELYDIMGLIFVKSRKELIELLTQRLKETFRIAYVGVYLYENWKKDKKLQAFDNGRSLLFTALLTDSFYLNEMKNKLNEHSVLPFDSFTKEKLNKKNVYVLSIKPEEEPHGFIIITNEDNRFNEPLLEQITLDLNKFFSLLNRCLHEQHTQAQNIMLLDLSSKLHSIYSTKEIFRVVIERLNFVYPHYSHYLLLSQDYEQDSSLPIKTINYGHETEMTAGTKAFINGEYEIEFNDELNETNIYTPLTGNQGVYGVIQTTIPTITRVLTEEIKFLKRFAQMIGQSIERTSLYQSSNRLVSDLQMINEASHKLNSNLEKCEIFNTVKKQIIDSCYATEVGFIQFPKNGDETFSVNEASTLFFTSNSNEHFLLQLYEEINKRDTSMFYGDFSAVHHEFPFQSVMIIPMKVSDYTYGTTIIMHENGYFFSFEKYKFIESLVQHATLALMNTSLKEELQQTVITDYLTKLYSRNYLDEMVVKHLEEDEQGVFILFDIDNFKQVNDEHGHSVGDKVLIQFANILKQNTPEKGFSARWGGEEFAVYVPEYTLDEGIDLANTIRKEAGIVTEPNVTVSSGVASWGETTQDSVKNIFIRADKALYQAKKTGKNKVVSELELE